MNSRLLSGKGVISDLPGIRLSCSVWVLAPVISRINTAEKLFRSQTKPPNKVGILYCAKRKTLKGILADTQEETEGMGTLRNNPCSCSLNKLLKIKRNFGSSRFQGATTSVLIVRRFQAFCTNAMNFYGFTVYRKAGLPKLL